MGKVKDACTLSLTALIISVIALSLQVIGFATPYWQYVSIADRKSYSGLWQKCQLINKTTQCDKTACEQTANGVPPATCITRLSKWINRNKPENNNGDYESLTTREINKFCPGGKINQVDCQTLNGMPYYSTGEINMCTEQGLICNHADNFPIPCSDYAIRYYCVCDPKKKVILNGNQCVNFKVVQATETLAVVLILTGLIFIILQMSKMTEKKVYKNVAAICFIIGGVFAIVGILVYSTMDQLVETTNLHFSFAFCSIAAVLAILSGVLYLIQQKL